MRTGWMNIQPHISSIQQQNSQHRGTNRNASHPTSRQLLFPFQPFAATTRSNLTCSTTRPRPEGSGRVGARRPSRCSVRPKNRLRGDQGCCGRLRWRWRYEGRRSCGRRSCGRRRSPCIRRPSHGNPIARVTIARRDCRRGAVDRDGERHLPRGFCTCEPNADQHARSPRLEYDKNNEPGILRKLSMVVIEHLGGCPPWAVVVLALSGTIGTQDTIVVVPILAGITSVV